jgi:hypothetical protein
MKVVGKFFDAADWREMDRLDIGTGKDRQYGSKLQPQNVKDKPASCNSNNPPLVINGRHSCLYKHCVNLST